MSTEPHPRPGGETRPQPGGETRPEPDLIERRTFSEVASVYVEAAAAGAGATTGALIVKGTASKIAGAFKPKDEEKPKDE